MSEIKTIKSAGRTEYVNRHSTYPIAHRVCEATKDDRRRWPSANWIVWGGTDPLGAFADRKDAEEFARLMTLRDHRIPQRLWDADLTAPQ